MKIEHFSDQIENIESDFCLTNHSQNKLCEFKKKGKSDKIVHVQYQQSVQKSKKEIKSEETNYIVVSCLRFFPSIEKYWL